MQPDGVEAAPDVRVTAFLKCTAHRNFVFRPALLFLFGLVGLRCMLVSPCAGCIIMSGRQISTTAIVGPSVYLLTRKDSLCYSRLISLPPRTLISSQLKIETIIAVGVCGGGTVLEATPSTPRCSIAVTLAGGVGFDFEG